MNNPTTCPVCANGSIFCRNGEVVKCPKCRGTGVIYPARTIATDGLAIAGIAIGVAFIILFMAYS